MRICAAFIVCTTMAASAAADTIVLKNGHRIVATNVTDANGKVSYETPAGEMSIPKSSVERIEKDDLTYAPAASAAKEAAIAATPSPQPVHGYEQIMSLAVHDGEVDYAYLAALDVAARSGSPEAVNKEAAGHYAAAQFLIAKGNTASAIDQFKQALVFAPQNLNLLLNVAVLYLKQSQFSEGIDWLERAKRVAPDSPDVAKLEGWAYYGANKVDQAVVEWQRAQSLRPDPDVAEALEKAQKDKSEEETYREGETLHFELKYSGAATPQLAREILRALENDFNDIASQLDYTPPEQIGVILYTNQAFADITRAPNWVGALNDGRLRIPVQGLTSITPDLARVLKHELTHSFIGQKTNGRAPVWVQEGIAQYMEGRRSTSAAADLISMANSAGPPDFSALEGSWLQLSASDASFAYAWSLAAIETIVNSGGISDVSRFLDAITVAPSTEQALRESLREDYGDLGAQTIVYLRHQYTH